MTNANKPPASIRARLLSLLWLKLLLMVGLNLIVFVPYHYFQRHHFFPTIVMQGNILDRSLPFLDWTVVIYLSIYLLMPIGPFLMNKRSHIFRYAAGVVLMGLVADVAFFFWPTQCPRPDVPFANAIYQSLIKIDLPFHACPSLHAAFAVYSALCGVLVLRETGGRQAWRAALWAWTAAILFATLTTKQHVFIDLVMGSILAVGAYVAAFLPINERRKNEAIPAMQSMVE